MIRKPMSLLVLALVAAAVAAPIARSDSAPKVDPLAVSYLIGRGLAPSEVVSWTTGPCSRENKPASCFAMFTRTAAPKVDPLAVSYLIGQGLTPSEVASWTTGTCSRQDKPASCFAMFDRVVPSIRSTPSTGFQWGDAGIGAGFTLGIVLLVGGAVAGLLISRQSRRREAAHA
jgi:hypothetical protein